MIVLITKGRWAFFFALYLSIVVFSSQLAYDGSSSELTDKIVKTWFNHRGPRL